MKDKDHQGDNPKDKDHKDKDHKGKDRKDKDHNPKPNIVHKSKDQIDEQKKIQRQNEQ